MVFILEQQVVRAEFDSNAKGWRKLLIISCAIVALGASALAGAWAHAHFYSSPVISPVHELALLEQASRDSAYIRENVNLLAEKVGTLQAKLIAIGGLSRRVADAAGVQYTEPELQRNLRTIAANNGPLNGAEQMAIMENSTFLVDDAGWSEPVMDLIDPEDGHEVTAEGLGRRLDSLYEQLVGQEDGLALLDLMLTRRAGIDASLPSFSPVDYPYLSSSFGWRRNPITGRHAMHEGLDFAAPAGTPIYAASGGVVTQARFRSGYGNLVEITHGNGLTTRYAHASSIKVQEGDLVDKGQTIAQVGSTGRSTGAHLHFEVRMGGHPLDPTLFLPPPPSSEKFIADASEHASPVSTQVR